MPTEKQFPKGTIILFLSFITLLVIVYMGFQPEKKPIPQELIAVLRPYEKPLQPFTLTDKTGQAFSLEKLKEKWSFLFFGYTYCPDVCPTTLTTLKHINNMLIKRPDIAFDTQVIFVSVDPERDSPKTLGEYTAYFSEEFIPVTGTADDLLSFSRQFSAAYIKETVDPRGDYLISHTSSIFLVNPKTRIVASFSPPHTPQIITSQYLKIYDMYK